MIAVRRHSAFTDTKDRGEAKGLEARSDNKMVCFSSKVTLTRS